MGGGNPCAGHKIDTEFSFSTTKGRDNRYAILGTVEDIGSVGMRLSNLARNSFSLSCNEECFDGYPVALQNNLPNYLNDGIGCD